MTDTEALAKALEDYADKWKEPKTSGLPARPAATALRAAAARIKALTEAGNAVVARWDTPVWKATEPTAAAIERLRAALSPAPEEGATHD